jgi:hypothetical protein
VAFLKEALTAFPFQVTHVLTDRGSCFTADGFERACEVLGVAHRTTRPYTPKTNGMVERFNGRIQREVLGITVASHRDLETLLQGFNRAYNARRQRVLKGRSPEMVVHERLGAVPTRANSSHDPPFNPCALPKALQVIARAKDVSHPDTGSSARGACAQTAPPTDQDAASAVLGQPDTPEPGRVDPAPLPDQPEWNEAAQCLQPD